MKTLEQHNNHISRTVVSVNVVQGPAIKPFQFLEIPVAYSPACTSAAISATKEREMEERERLCRAAVLMGCQSA